MMKCIILCISFFITGSIAEITGAASFIKPCRQTDSECIVNSAKIALPHLVGGVKELGLAPLDPLDVYDIDVNTGDLKLYLKNIVITGLSKCKFNKIERDPVKSTGLLDVNCGIKAVGNYNVSGQLLYVELDGEGPFDINGDEFNIIVTFKLKIITKNGQQYYKVSGFDFSYTLLSKFSIKFHNLFDGDRVKAEPIEKILDESANELILDPNIGRKVIVGLIKQVVKIIDKLLQSIPIKDIEIAE